MPPKNRTGIGVARMMAAKPFVFVAMPFGKKRDPQTATDIDFDAIFEAGVKPAVKRFDVDCLRADEERAGGVIHLPSRITRALIARLALRASTALAA